MADEDGKAGEKETGAAESVAAGGPHEDLEKSVDEDWKAQARRDREKLEAKVKEQASRRAAEMPPADFMHFVSGMAAQALMQLGAIENPLDGGKKRVDLAAARYSIDILQMLADKAKGNLTEEEDRYIRAALHDLRMRFVDAAQAAAPGPGEATGQP